MLTEWSNYMRKNTGCKRCGGELTTDPETSELVCTSCGVVSGYNNDASDYGEVDEEPE
jgi:transcription initiation factor TFIIIB Brf1 subunit/transcription initiation factor TFIIB